MNFDSVRKVVRLAIPLSMLLCALTMSGCDRGKSSVGTYLSEKNPQDITELKSDGTFLVHQGKMDVSGKYSIEGKTLTLTLNSGNVMTGAIDGKTITDDTGEHWTKK